MLIYQILYLFCLCLSICNGLLSYSKKSNLLHPFRLISKDVKQHSSNKIFSCTPVINNDIVEELDRSRHFDLLSTSFKDLISIVDGSGKAKIFWEALKLGQDPLNQFANDTLSLSPKAISHIRENILEGKPLLPTEVTQETLSSCGTRKLLLQLHDGLTIESVLIPSYKHDRTTICVSTQIGCDRGCKFCATGTMSLIRNLTSSEIISQVIHGMRISRREQMPTLRNVVFMGMGDSARNYVEVGKAVDCLTDRYRMGMAKGKITISTVGPSPEIFMELAKMNGTLAWSLHSADESIRKKLVPSTRHSIYDLRQGLLDALLSRPIKARTLMIAFTLIDGINDSIMDAQKIAEFVQPMLEVAPKILLDLIPYNDISVPGFHRPDQERIWQFQKYLREKGFFVSVRVTRGDDESSACGMLVTKKYKKNQSIVQL